MLQRGTVIPKCSNRWATRANPWKTAAQNKFRPQQILGCATGRLERTCLADARAPPVSTDVPKRLEIGPPDADISRVYHVLCYATVSASSGLLLFRNTEMRSICVYVCVFQRSCTYARVCVCMCVAECIDLMRSVTSQFLIHQSSRVL